MLAGWKPVHVLVSLLMTAGVVCGDESLNRAEAPPADYEWVSLPTDRDTRSELLPLEVPQRPDLSRLMCRRLRFAAEWELKTDGVEIGNYDVKLTVPTYPLYGPPPPFISAGFSYTGLTAPAAFQLPSSLYDISFGAAWMRPLNERWMLRFMASAAFASDMDNNSSDAWQFRGGVLATYKWTENLQLIVGAIASGRDDIPVLPGLGAIWTPSPSWRVNLMMPRPRVAYLLADTGARQHWIFLGGGLSGGTWAFENDGLDDKLTYREWRFGLGWESGPPRSTPFMSGDGLNLEAELGYVFGREFEFERRTDEIGIGGTLLLRMGANY